jgi:hypothetical protein
MRLILEGHLDLAQLAAFFHEAVLMAVDENVRNRRILHQWLQRAKANHLVDNVVHEGFSSARR